MSINQIPGQLLQGNLERDGNSLAFVNTANSTPTLFLDIANSYVGINTATPQTALDVVGTLSIDTINPHTLNGNIEINANANVTGNVSVNGNVTSNYFIGNGSQLTGIAASSVNANNLVGNTLSSNVTISSLTAVGTLATLSVTGNTTSGNLLTGGYVSATGNVNAGNIIITGILVDTTGNLDLQTTAANGNINMTPNGTGVVTVSTQLSAAGKITSGNVAYTNTDGTSGQVLTTYGNGITYFSTVSGGGGGGSITVSDQTASANIFYPLFGNVTTGTLSTVNTSSTKLTYIPNTGTLNATIFNTTSDENKKTNIETIFNALDIVENLRGVTFEFNDTGVLSAGLIAQDVEKYLPQLISTTENGKALNYNGVIGILVEAVKELSAQVKKLENK